jgi:RNA polymerase sigma-70 factor (ECF subfamily)
VSASDESLFQQVQDGRRDAFALLVGRYQGRAFSVALRLLGHRQDAEDAVQEAFLKLYRSRASFNSRWRFNTWFYRILTNVCVDALRLRRSMIPLTEEHLGTADSPQHALEAGEQNRILAGALETVSVEARMVLTLYYGEGKSYREIGAIRGISVNTVKTHLRRGRDALRHALQAQGVSGP